MSDNKIVASDVPRDTYFFCSPANQFQHETKVVRKPDLIPKPILDLHIKNPYAKLMWDEMVKENFESLKANSITAIQVIVQGS